MGLFCFFSGHLVLSSLLLVFRVSGDFQSQFDEVVSECAAFFIAS
jgi:hypothetical protein